MRTSFRCAFVLLLLLLAPAVWAEAEAEEPADPAQLRAETQRRIDEEARDLPHLGTYRIDQVVRFTVEQGDLVVHTSLPPSEQQGQVTIPTLPGLTRVHAMPRRPNWPAEAPPPFQFIHRRLSEDGGGLTQISVLSGPGSLIVARDTDSPHQSIQLVQTFHFFDPTSPLQEAPVRLYVHATDSQTGQRTVNITLTADSFEALRRGHPQEVAQYLQPIFRDLAADIVFAVDPRVAWQVFADRFQPEPELSRKLEAIIPQLDGETFQQREDASEALEALEQPAALALMAMDRSQLSAEQNSRIEAFLAPFRPLDADEKRRLRDSTDFLLNTLLLEDRPLRQAALERLQAIHPGPIEFDLDATPEQRLARVQRLRDQLSEPAD